MWVISYWTVIIIHTVHIHEAKLIVMYNFQKLLTMQKLDWLIKRNSIQFLAHVWLIWRDLKEGYSAVCWGNFPLVSTLHFKFTHVQTTITVDETQNIFFLQSSRWICFKNNNSTRKRKLINFIFIFLVLEQDPGTRALHKVSFGTNDLIKTHSGRSVTNQSNLIVGQKDR